MKVIAFRKLSALSDEKKSNSVVLPIAEAVYLLYFFTLFISRSLGIYEGQPIYKYVLLLSGLFYIWKELLTEKTILEYAITVTLLTVAGLVYMYSGEKGLLLYFTMMLGMKGVSSARVIRLSLASLISCYLVMIITTTCGLRNSFSKEVERFGGWMTRETWGYPGMNVAHTTFLIILILLICCLGMTNIRQVFCVFLLAFFASVYVFLHTASYTGMIGCVLCMISYVYLHFRKKLCIVEKVGFVAIYPFLGTVSIGVPLFASEELLGKLDSFLHNRMNYSRYFLQEEPLSLFGIRLAPTPNENYYIDSAYIYSFLQIGIVSFVILTGLFIWFAIACVRRDRRAELITILTFSVMGLSDPFLYNLGYKNIMFLWYGELLYEKLGQMKESEHSPWNKILCLPTNRWGQYAVVYRGKVLERMRLFAANAKQFWENRCVSATGIFFGVFVFLFAGLVLCFRAGLIEGLPNTVFEWNVTFGFMNYSTIVATACVFGYGKWYRK